MRFLKQFSIIIIITFIAELLHHFIPLPFPASIYGLVLMFLALRFKLFPVDEVKETSDFLTGIMPILFVPPSVSIIKAFPVLKDYWWQFLLIAVLSTFLVMFCSGKVTELFMKLKSGNRNNKAKGEKNE